MFLAPLSLSSLVSGHYKMSKQPLSTMSSCPGVHHTAAQRHLSQLTVVKSLTHEPKSHLAPSFFPSVTESDPCPHHTPVRYALPIL